MYLFSRGHITSQGSYLIYRLPSADLSLTTSMATLIARMLIEKFGLVLKSAKTFHEITI